MLTVRSILCPVDFSEQSRQALLWASVIAQLRGGALTVLTVVEPLLARAAGIRLGVDLARAEAKPALREFVEATLPERVRRGLHVRIEVTVTDERRVRSVLKGACRSGPTRVDTATIQNADPMYRGEEAQVAQTIAKWADTLAPR
jgi:nucleotide-binding universal stress UspA family protein